MKSTASTAGLYHQGTSIHSHSNSSNTQRHPRQVQVYHNDLDNTSYDGRSQTSSSRSHPSTHTPNAENNTTYNPYTYNGGSYVCETYNDERQQDNQEDHLPEGNILIKNINGTQVDTFALCLFDSGSTVTLFNERALPLGVKPKVGQKQSFTTTQGTYSAQNYVLTKDIYFPEFCHTFSIPVEDMKLFCCKVRVFAWIRH